MSPLPAELRAAIVTSGKCLNSRCFDNSWHLVMERIVPDGQYVLALGTRCLPTEHALIFVNGVYYDPTWEIYLGDIGKEYLLIAKWDRTELPMVARMSADINGDIYPPMIRTLKDSGQFGRLFLD